VISCSTSYTGIITTIVSIIIGDITKRGVRYTLWGLYRIKLVRLIVLE